MHLRSETDHYLLIFRYEKDSESTERVNGKVALAYFFSVSKNAFYLVNCEGVVFGSGRVMPLESEAQHFTDDKEKHKELAALAMQI